LKGTKPFRFPLLTQVIRGDSNPLQKIRSGFRQEYNGLCRFKLGKEQPRGSPITVPVGEEFECGTCDPRIALVSPVLHAVPEEIHQCEWDPLTTRFMFRVSGSGFRVAIKVPGWASSFPTFWEIALFNVPMLGWL
jgi:hypothetical protein